MTATDRAPDAPEPVPVKALPVGARFSYRGEVWKVRENARYVDAEAEQFSNHLTFYDAATARKSGDLCWDVTVKPLRTRGASDENCNDGETDG